MNERKVKMNQILLILCCLKCFLLHNDERAFSDSGNTKHVICLLSHSSNLFSNRCALIQIQIQTQTQKNDDDMYAACLSSPEPKPKILKKEKNKLQ